MSANEREIAARPTESLLCSVIFPHTLLMIRGVQASAPISRSIICARIFMMSVRLPGDE